MRLTRRHVLIAAPALAAITAAPVLATERLSGPAFGGSWHAVLPPGADVAKVAAAFRAEIGAVDRAMSPYLPGSELALFNRSRRTGWHTVSPVLAEVLGAALALCRQTGGAFDPTVGPIVHRFGFGPIEGSAAGGPDLLSVRPTAVRKAASDLTIDLCGIAKGHALDRMVDAAIALGHRDFLIEVGGEIAARGRHPDGRDWRTAIERPGNLAAQRILRLDGQAVATSGHAANGFRRPHLSHIIDPRTARPVAAGLASVSVVDVSARRADALATALLVLGPRAGPAFAESMNIPALFLVEDGSDLREVMTGRFDDLVLA